MVEDFLTRNEIVLTLMLKYFYELPIYYIEIYIVL